MNNALNNFMVGKKKYSASVILPIVIAIIQVMVADPDKAQSIVALVQEFLPTVIALVGGIAYTIVEGINDNTRIKNPAGNGITPGSPPVFFQPEPPAQASGSAAAYVQPDPPAPPWDVKAFDDKVKQKTPITYGVANPSTELFQALNQGQETPCEHIEHAEAFWDYATMKADARFSDIWGYSFREALAKVAEPGTPTHPTPCGSFSNLKHKALALGEAYYTAYLDYDRIRETTLNVQTLGEYSRRGFNWKAKLASVHQNLYFIGEMAAELLRYCK